MNMTTASSITRAASKQTFYTIRFLVDHGLVEDAYRAYGYYRWVDDILDEQSSSGPERLAFLNRQKTLLEACYRGRPPKDVNLQENMLVELIRNDRDQDSGLHFYLYHMMLVMEFDARRRGRLISESELSEYTYWLASAVMEVIHYFIGHDDFSPHDETRYLAVSGAHITHMLRDTFDDMKLGYYNVPREILDANPIGPRDVAADVYRQWVKSRVLLARQYFAAGKEYFARVQNPRCRMACFAYIARFEWLLDTIEKEGYCLRPQYSERKSFGTAAQMSWLTLASIFHTQKRTQMVESILPHSTGKL